MQEPTTHDRRYAPTVAKLARVEADASSTLQPSPPGQAARDRSGIAVFAMLLDGMLIWLAFCSAYYLRYVLRWVPTERGTLLVPFAAWIPFGMLFSAMVLLALAALGLYRARLGRGLLDEALVVVQATLVAVGLVGIVSTLLPVVQYSRFVIVYAWLLLVVYVVCGRALLGAILKRLHGRGWNVCRVLVVGTSPISKMVMQNLLDKRDRGYLLVGFLRETQPSCDPACPNPVPQQADFGRFKCLGLLAELERVVQDWSVDEVIVALPARHHGEIAEICTHCEQAGVAVKLVPDLFEMSISRVHMDHLAGIPLIDLRRARPGRLARGIKRGMDVVIAGTLVVLASPLLVLTALAIKLDSTGPVVNRQTRIGKGNRPFTFYKFRSMHVHADEHWAAMAAQKGIVDPRIFKDRNDPRRTRVGRVIRRLSIDELPQLFNVLRGDMSMVGPRPPLPNEVARYEPHHFKRLEVTGGITGLWQVSGRSNVESFEEIIIMDTYYIDNWSLRLDARILLRTVLAVLARTGAY